MKTMAYICAMNIHQKINFRSAFAHQFAVDGVLQQSLGAFLRGYKNGFRRPHRDRRNFRSKQYKCLGYNLTKSGKYHSVYPKQ